MSVNKYYRYKNGETFDTGRWKARVYLGRKPDGTSKQKTKIFDRKKDAERWDREMRRKKDLGELIEESDKPFSDVLEEWFKTKKAQLAQSTLDRYQSMLECHIIPVLGSIPLNDLNSTSFREFYAEKRENGHMRKPGEGLSETTLKQAHVIMNSALKWSVREGWLRQNPMNSVETPKPEQKEMRFLSVEDTQQLLDVSMSSDSIYQWFYPCIVLTGLRRSELLGLRVQDLNLKKQTLSVKKVLVRTARNQYVRKQPKSEASKRTIRITDKSIPYFEKQIEKRNRIKQKLGKDWPETNLLFVSSKGTRINPSNLHRHKQRLWEKAQIPEVTIHELRHTFGALMAHGEVGLDYLKKHMGHESIETTIDIYGHMYAARSEEAGDRFDELVFDDV